MVEQKPSVVVEMTDEVRTVMSTITNLKAHLPEIQQVVSDMFDKYNIQGVNVVLNITIDKNKMFKVEKP